MGFPIYWFKKIFIYQGEVFISLPRLYQFITRSLEHSSEQHAGSATSRESFFSPLVLTSAFLGLFWPEQRLTFYICVLLFGTAERLTKAGFENFWIKTLDNKFDSSGCIYISIFKRFLLLRLRNSRSLSKF